MIKRLIEVLNTAGLEISHEQLADALWLGLHIPPEQSSAGLVHEPPQTTVLVDAVHENAAPVPHPPAPYERPEWTSTAPKPGELFVPKPGFSRLASDQDRIPAVTVRVPRSRLCLTKMELTEHCGRLSAGIRRFGHRCWT
jgi:hypothetical protein